jgi:CBS-domain-containing membrane protein
MEVLKSAGVAVASTLGRSMAKIDPDMYDVIISAWNEAAKTPEKPDEVEKPEKPDEVEEVEEVGETLKVTPMDVRAILRAYAKEFTREKAEKIMSKYGVHTLGGINDCTPKELSAMYIELEDKIAAKKAKADIDEVDEVDDIDEVGDIDEPKKPKKAKADIDEVDDIDDIDEVDEVDDIDEPEVTAEAVKIALKAYAKEVGRDEAREIMRKHGASALSKVDECSPKQLSAMFDDLI